MTHPVTLVTDVTRFPTLSNRGRSYVFAIMTSHSSKKIKRDQWGVCGKTRHKRHTRHGRRKADQGCLFSAARYRKVYRFCFGIGVGSRLLTRPAPVQINFWSPRHEH